MSCSKIILLSQRLVEGQKTLHKRCAAHEGAGCSCCW